MKDLTRGNIKKNLRSLTFPFFAMSMIGVATQLIDTIWVGRLIGQDALAAAIVCGVILYLIFSIFSGIGSGGSILIGQYFGAKRVDEISKVVFNCIVLGMILCIGIVLVNMFAVDNIMAILRVPKVIYPQVVVYLNVVCYGCVIGFLYNVLAMIFRAVGETKIPIIMSVMTLALNFMLDPIFIKWIGIEGAPLATWTSFLITGCFGLYSVKKKNLLNLSFSRKSISFEMIRKILIIGIPTSIENMVVSLGVATTQFLVNRYGVSAVAAFGVGGQVDNMMLMFGGSVGGAVMVITAQNKGKGNHKRMLLALRYGVKFGFWITAGVSCIGFIFAKQFCEFFITQSQAPEVINLGIDYVRVMCFAYVCLIVYLVFLNFFNGVGDTRAAMILSLLAMWVGRIPLAYVVSQFIGVQGIWIGIAASYIVAMLVGYGYFRMGRWKKIKII